MKKSVLTFVSFSFLILVPAVRACDSCGCALHQPIVFDSVEPTPAPKSGSSSGKDAKDLVIPPQPQTSFVFAGASTQYTYFGTLQVDGVKVPNEVHQYLHSVITQAYVGYQINDRFSVQVNVPYIDREYKRPDGFAIDRGSVSGLGDVALAFNTVPFRYATKEASVDWTLGGGVQFPTGDSNRLREELTETEIPGAPESGIHGHDLALGGGSYNGFFVTGVDAHWKQLFFTADVQYTLRTTGIIDYRYANEIGWSAGPGFEFISKSDLQLGVQLVASGEDKGLDTFQGAKAEDTGITSVYLGPKINLGWTDRINGQFAVEVPVSLDNTSLQAVPDYRLKAGIVWRF